MSPLQNSPKNIQIFVLTHWSHFVTADFSQYKDMVNCICGKVSLIYQSTICYMVCLHWQITNFYFAPMPVDQHRLCLANCPQTRSRLLWILTNFLFDDFLRLSEVTNPSGHRVLNEQNCFPMSVVLALRVDGVQEYIRCIFVEKHIY